MQISSGFQVFRSEKEYASGRGRQGDENPGVPPKEEVGRGILCRNQDNGGLSLRDIKWAIEYTTKVPFEQYKVGDRVMGKLLKLRVMFTSLCRKFLEYSYPQIGRLFSKDHTTAVFYKKKHDQYKMDPEYLEQYNQIEANVEEILKQKRNQEDAD